MAKKAEVKDVENTAVEVQTTETKPKEPDFNTVKLSEIPVGELVSYKKIADLMFEYYDNEANTMRARKLGIRKPMRDRIISG